ncbi:TIGR03557 family F420-dependent LLM class oxidoreductase [Methanobacterium sp. ACI-7]|uniref:TIGR03557 family F420-dependent LLM class oxidoreductase n=1 Tax=unclassified Methanobacterium TaxID=2627676 RepID=UPI0039C391B5
MVELGYKLTSEQQDAASLVKLAKMAEDAGFSYAMISDHYHPWLEAQGQSPFVWCTLGGISQVTNTLEIGTAVTCPTVRIHPAVIAQAAATAASMLPGRFIFGVGSGENLNEHILGDKWHSAPIRIDMLEEAVDVIRTLWQGGMQDYDGIYYVVENAQIYTLPEKLPPIIMAADGPIAAEAAARSGDGLMASGGKNDIIDKFKESGGEGPCYSEVTLSWGKTDDDAIDMAYKYWPIMGLKGEFGWELATTTHFDQIAENVEREDVAKKVLCSSDPEDHIKKIQKSVDAGYTHVCIQQIGIEQEDFIDFYSKEILPTFNDQ